MKKIIDELLVFIYFSFLKFRKIFIVYHQKFKYRPDRPARSHFFV